MKLRTTLLWIVIGSFVAAALLGIMVILAPNMFRVQDEILGTVAVLGAMSLPALGCAIVLDRHRLNGMMWFGICAALVGFAIWMLFMWFNPWRWNWPSAYDEDELIKFGITLTAGSAWACHFGLLTLLGGVKQVFRWARVSTLTFGTWLFAHGMVMLWLEWETNTAERLGAVLAILES